MARGEQYHLRVSQVSDWTGALRLGVTWHDPATLTSLPRYSFPDLIRRPGFWVRTIREQHLSDGARRVMRTRDSDRMIHFLSVITLRARRST